MAGKKTAEIIIIQYSCCKHRSKAEIFKGNVNAVFVNHTNYGGIQLLKNKNQSSLH